MTTMTCPSTATLDFARPLGATAVDTATMSAGSGHDLSGSAVGWRKALEVLERWWLSPEFVSDEEITAPSRRMIDLAFRRAASWRDERLPAPLRVVPDGEGGIVFERRSGDLFETIEFGIDESISQATFRSGRFIGRRLLKQGKSSAPNP